MVGDAVGGIRAIAMSIASRNGHRVSSVVFLVRLVSGTVVLAAGEMTALTAPTAPFLESGGGSYCSAVCLFRSIFVARKMQARVVT